MVLAANVTNKLEFHLCLDGCLAFAAIRQLPKVTIGSKALLDWTSWFKQVQEMGCTGGTSRTLRLPAHNFGLQAAQLRLCWQQLKLLHKMHWCSLSHVTWALHVRWQHTLRWERRFFFQSLTLITRTMD